MKAMILAAGKGERMQPLTLTTPKPLLSIGKHRLIEEHLFRLKAAGFDEVIINTWYLAEKIEHFLGDGQNYGLRISYSNEQNSPEPLETAGGIIKALPFFHGEDFLVINADIYCDYAPCKHSPLQNQLAHLILVNNPPHHPKGDFGIDHGHLSSQAQPRYTFAGIAYYKTDFFEHLAPKPAPLAPLLTSFAEQQKITAELYQGTWLDIGTPERLEQLRQQNALKAEKGLKQPMHRQ